MSTPEADTIATPLERAGLVATPTTFPIVERYVQDADGSPTNEVPVFMEARMPHQEEKKEGSIAMKVPFVNREELEDAEYPGVKAVYTEDTVDWLDDVKRELCTRQEEERYLRKVIEIEDPNKKRRTFALVSGPPGTGRSSLARSIESLAQESAGYFIIGKFDQLCQPTPYGAYVMAINQFINLVLRRGEAEVLKFSALIATHVGSNTAVLRSWIPAVDRITGAPSEPTALHSGSMDRFAFALKALHKAMSLLGRPIYMLFDDLQLADQCSLDLLLTMLRHRPLCGGYCVATCDNNVAPDSAMAVKLREIEDIIGLEIINIPMEFLSQERIYEALAASCALNQSDRATLARIIYERTGGNSFLSGLFLNWIREKGFLSRNLTSDTLFVDEEEIDVSLGQKQGLDLLVSELESFPVEEQDVLKVAACLGHVINVKFVSFVLDRSIDETLFSLTEKGLLYWCERSEAYCLSHDCVQEAAYTLVPENDRPLFHLEIGRRLWRKVKDDDLESIFLILDQIQRGRDLIKREKERLALANLCLYAGEKAASSSSFLKALSVFELGVFLLDEGCWRKEYDLALSLHSATIEMQMYAAKFEDMDKLIDYTIAHSRTQDDKMRAYTCRINSLSVRGQLKECVAVSLNILSMLGVPLQLRLCKVQVFHELKGLKKLLWGKSDEQLLRLPKMTDHNTLEAMRIMSLMMFPAMSSKSVVAPLVMLRLMRLTLTMGHSIFSPVAFVAYAIVCTTGGFQHNVDEGFRFGQLALKLLDQESRIEYLPRVHVCFFSFIHGWKKPVKQTLCPLLRAHTIGVETGDMEFASIAAFMFCIGSTETGHHLDDVHRSIQTFFEVMVSKRQESLIIMCSPFVEYVRRLIGAKEHHDFDSLIKRAREMGFEKAVCVAHLWKMRLCYIFGEVEEAGRLSEETDFSVLMNAPHMGIIGFCYLVAIIACTNLRIGRNVKFHKGKARRIMKQFRRWARDCPHECSGKSALIEAEWASVHGRAAIAREKYTNAILLAKGMDNNYDLATAHERALHHYLGINDKDEACWHGEQAHEAYRSWGATSKAAHLKESLAVTFNDHRSPQLQERLECLNVMS
jgi:predicted ATPase